MTTASASITTAAPGLKDAVRGLLFSSTVTFNPVWLVVFFLCFKAISQLAYLSSNPDIPAVEQSSISMDLIQSVALSVALGLMLQKRFHADTAVMAVLWVWIILLIVQGAVLFGYTSY